MEPGLHATCQGIPMTTRLAGPPWCGSGRTPRCLASDRLWDRPSRARTLVASLGAGADGSGGDPGGPPPSPRPVSQRPRTRRTASTGRAGSVSLHRMPDEQQRTVVVSAPRIGALLALVVALMVFGGVAVVVADYVFGHDHLWGLRYRLDLDRECNVPTWYSSVSLFLAALLLCACEERARGSVRTPLDGPGAHLRLHFPR